MDITKEAVNPNPRDKSTPLGLLFFTYTFGIFKRGYSKVLDVDDLYNPIKSDRSMLLGDRLERVWHRLYEKANKKQKKASLLVGLLQTFWPELTILGITLVLMQVFSLIQPMMLGQLLAYFRADTGLTKQDAFLYAGAISVCTFLNALLSNQYIMGAFHYGMKIRAACCALVYRKSLRLSKTALGETASGKIVNLLSNDVSRFDMVIIFVHHMWVAPVVTMIITYLMWVDSGWAGIFGIGTVFIVVPIQGYTGKLSAIYRKATAQKTDERVRLMDEILSGIQVIKMYAWEIPFAKLVRMARKAEVKIITKSSYVRGAYMAFNLFTTRLALFGTLLTVALMDQPITASKVFVIMSYLNIVSQTMSQMFVRGISEMAELLVAIKRLEGLMLNEEFVSLTSTRNNTEYDAKKHLIDLQNLYVKWNARLSDNALEDINLTVNRGQLVGVIGPVGSGKSSLLQTILGELEMVSGKIAVNGTLSYASQEAWVFAATVRQNITFGSEYDKKKYNDVVKACALEKDFEQFSNGDLTIVGDRGASLSGGQKARINLARAIYREADIYLLDDPLSAVDIHVSKHLYDLCINGYLYNKTRVLVTHQVHHLKDADHILILNNGRIENEGNFKDLSNSDNLYAQLLTSEPEATDEEKQKITDFAKKDRKMSVRSIKSLASAMSELSIPEAILAEQDEDSEEDEREIKMKDMQEESSKGKVKGNLFWKYFSAGGNFFFIIFVFLLFLLAEGAAMAVDYFVSFWVKIEEYKTTTEFPVENSTSALNSTDYVEAVKASPFGFNAITWEKDLFLYIYGSLIISLFVLVFSRSMLFYKLAMMSSQKLHDSIFYSVINASMRFFDTNPGGRILNRFSKDIGSVDELLPKAIMDASQMILMSLGSIILITIVNPIFLAVVAIIGGISMVIRHVYLKSSKNIKRLEGVMRSPVFTHLNATINGLTTIRAFEAQGILRDEFDKYQDGHTSAWFMFIAASSAFGLCMDMLCFVFITLITFSFLLFSEEIGITGGDVGLAITQAVSLSMMVQWGLRQSAEVANQLMSVERVLEYKQLPAEKQPVKPKEPPKSWPSRGEIKFRDMGMRYDEDGALILKQLNLKIDPNEKVGIVGRTGAGKSSLISALFRLAHVEGSIQIDDIDTKEIVLEQLRSKISIIPQDPVLFSGTLRYNLDPFEEYTDDLLYKAIEEVELKDPANIINRLESRVMDRGANYSVGQRQLICLARAIVRNNKILMLDEATANVDPQTDALIQKTIRKKFATCTVLTVAHRLNTIMDSDKVLVMDSGTMVEFDHPHNLLQNPNSVFCHMVDEAGRGLSEQLRKIAKEKCKVYLMDTPFKLKHENPKKKANCFSKLFFMWAAPLFYTGTKRLLRLEDLFKPLDPCKSKYIGDNLEQSWLSEVAKAKENNRPPSLLKALNRVFLREFMKYGILLFVMMVLLRSPQPLVLSWLIAQFQEGTDSNTTTMFSAASILILVSTVVIFIMHHSNCNVMLMGMKLRVGVSSLINRKVLKLSTKVLDEAGAGKVVNLLSNDCQRFDLICYYLHYLWIMPFQIILVTYFLWDAVGISCLAGILSLLLLTVPLQAMLGRNASALRLKIAERSDERVKLMNQIISGIQVIKMYAWEKPFELLIETLRGKEISVVTKASYLRGFYLSCMVFIERTTLCVTLVCFVLLGNGLQANIVFSMAQFFNILQVVVAIMYPMAISIGAETLVCIKRLEDFLLLEERQEYSVERIEAPEVSLKCISASWVPNAPTLRNINLVVPKGCLCAIVGPVGAGKSSILQLLLGELAPTVGTIKMGGEISYASQEPWLFAASVRKNILFGNDYNSALYKKVTKACALESDFLQLPHGDRTTVGERGVSLSGGQRARINLARAVYRQADVYLLDDPLSAVDTHVGKHLFDKCIIKHLRGKTRILVTHQLQYLKKADLIIVLNEGKIEAMGTFAELSNTEFDFAKLLTSADETNEEKDKESKENKRSFERSSSSLKNPFRALSDNESEIESTVEENEEAAQFKDGKSANPFLDYIKSTDNAGYILFTIFVLLSSQASCLICDLWVAFWTNQEELRHIKKPPQPYAVEELFQANSTSPEPLLKNSTYFYNHTENSATKQSILGIPFSSIFDELEIGQTIYSLLKTDVAMIVYGCSILLVIALTVGRSFLFFNATMKASRNIHSNMFHCLLKAPMRFFDINPSGRVLNRFSKDIGAIDEILPRVLLEAIQIFLVMGNSLLVVTISNYYMLIAIVLLGGIFLKVRTWYIASSRAIKHLEGIAKSPIFTHINCSLRGLTTIRACEAQRSLIREFDDHQDIHTSTWYLTVICGEFFGLWLDILCVVFIACISFAFVISVQYGQAPNGSMVGLALSQAMVLTGMLQYGMKQTAEVINQLTSVERVLHYGKVEFKNLSLSYVPTEAPVLKHLNLLIHSGEKVGIVGRTGAGKSSLISALFRLAPIEGNVLIDDLNTKVVGLRDLRRRISIIPQEPVLFKGTLRFNLDPFGEFRDQQLWTALEEVELKDVVASLHFEVSEGGTNFSLGQRQLLCLARALLRNNKVMILDEATANVDALTDNLIQRTIRRKFSHCTVLTIAHRLNTIMDSNRVLVMSRGEILEFDHPHNLLQNPKGCFTRMVMETGTSMTEQLRNVALSAWNERDEEMFFD
ncbi:hypothetical protein HUJ05_003874 [Dendroctonus ponderosae]|nr:hypothetical protein HUJ05_003874 [Dendroctonus ponderosae]